MLVSVLAKAREMNILGTLLSIRKWDPLPTLERSDAIVKVCCRLIIVV